jgi:LOB domain-containing protein 29
MAGSGTPCGACKFLRRKCVRGCVFAPYFCHEQGAAHFAAIHKVFGASNVSKLLAHLPVTDRPEAAMTISYEAQARIQDPVYGCVSHIFALQQQVTVIFYMSGQHILFVNINLFVISTSCMLKSVCKMYLI